jgi:hypothetical protein
MRKMITQAFLVSAITAQDAKVDADVAKIMSYVNMAEIEA